MRHDYQLTEETLKTFKGNEGAIAEEADVGYKYVSAIMSGAKTDPFAPFKHFYRAAARAGVSRCHWRNTLDAIDARYEKKLPNKTEVECLTDKINSDADTTAKMVEALRDGHIDAHEARKILQAIDKERSILDLLEVRLQFHVELKER